MSTCSGCKQQQLMLAEILCLSCVEELGQWLRSIPLLFDELDAVRLPGSVRQSGPYAKTSSTGSAAPVRLAVVDMLDRGEVLARLRAAWPGGEWFWSVEEACGWFRQHLLTLVLHDEATELYRRVRGLVRDLGRTVGEPQEQSVGKCSEPDADGELCRGALFRTTDGDGVFCRRCGSKPEMRTQQVWCTIQHAAMVTGRPVKTIRTWANRYSPLQVWCPPIDRGLVWLPDVVRLADRVATTLPHASDSLSPGSRAEPSPESGALKASPGSCSVSDADVLGQVAPGNVTPSAVATAGTDAALGPIIASVPSGPPSTGDGSQAPGDRPALAAGTGDESLTGGGPSYTRAVHGFEKGEGERRSPGSRVEGSIPSQDSPPC